MRAATICASQSEFSLGITMTDNKTWSSEEIFELISLFKAHRELWDVRHKHYRNKIYKQKVLHKIASRINVSSIEIHRKLHNLRTQFYQEFRRMQNGGYTTTWKYYEAMSFIRNCPPTRKPPRKLVSKYKDHILSESLPMPIQRLAV